MTDDSSQSSTSKWRPSSKLYPRQLEGLTGFLAGPQRHSLLYGGARSTKTFLIIYVIFVRASRAPGSFHKALRLHGNAARASLWLETIPKVRAVCFPNLSLREWKVDSFFEFPNESRLYVGGLDEGDRTEKILGTECATLFVNEGSQTPYSSIEDARSRLAQRSSTDRGDPLPQREYIDLNPPSKTHWSYLEFFRHLHPVTRAPLANPDEFRGMFFKPEDNPTHDPAYIASLKAMSKRKRERFYEGKYQDETEGALWTQDAIDASRVLPSDVPRLARVVVAVDPSGAGSSEDKNADEIGIVVVGLGEDGHGYVLADFTDHYSPKGWGAKVVSAWREYGADRIVAEVNYGGAMVVSTIRVADPNAPVKVITSSRGKHLRAEPVSALYEHRPHDGLERRMHHVARADEEGRDHLVDLEDEMLGFTAAGYDGPKSPNRADAMVFGATELMLTASAQGWIDHLDRMIQRAGAPAPEGPAPVRSPLAEPAAAPKPPAPVNLVAPAPHAVFAPATGIRYTAGHDGIIRDVSPAHVEALVNAGCHVAESVAA